MTITRRYTREEPYRSITGSERPFLPVRLQYGGRYFDTVALIDSGADGSFFNGQFATILGLTLDPAAAVQSQGVGGMAQTWELDVHLTVLGKRFPARVGFSMTWPPTFGLLGRKDFFRAFAVGIDEIRQRALLNPNTGWP